MTLATALLVLALGADARAETTRTFAPSGGTPNPATGIVEEQFQVPSGVTELHVTAIGGAGQTVKNVYTGQGGLGAKVTSTLKVNPGGNLYVQFVPGGAGGKSTAVFVGENEFEEELELFTSINFEGLVQETLKSSGFTQACNELGLEQLAPAGGFCTGTGTGHEIASLGEEIFTNPEFLVRCKEHPSPAVEAICNPVSNAYKKNQFTPLAPAGGQGGGAVILGGVSHSSVGASLVVAGGGGGGGGSLAKGPSANGGDAGQRPQEGNPTYALPPGTDVVIDFAGPGEPGSLSSGGAGGNVEFINEDSLLKKIQEEEEHGERARLEQEVREWEGLKRQYESLGVAPFGCAGGAGAEASGGSATQQWSQKNPLTGISEICGSGGGGGAGFFGGGAGQGSVLGGAGGGAGSSYLAPGFQGTIGTAGSGEPEELVISYQEPAHPTRTTLTCPAVVEDTGGAIKCQVNVEDTVTHEQVSGPVEDVWEVNTDCADHLPTAVQGSAPGNFEWNPHEPGVRTAYAHFKGSGEEEPSTSSCTKVSYAEPPSITINSPVSGHVYTEGEEPAASFGCGEGYGTEDSIAKCEGPVGNGAKLNLGAGGTHTFTVHAVGGDGLKSEKTVSYEVTSKAATETKVSCPPVVEFGSGPIVCTTTVEDASTHAPVTAGVVEGLGLVSLECADDLPMAMDTTPGGQFSFQPGSPGVYSAFAGYQGSALDAPSKSHCVKVFYAEPPSITISGPAQGAVYTEGEEPTVSFECSEGIGSEETVASCEGTQPTGSKLASTPGKHTFTVDALGGDGLRSERSVSYEVQAKMATSCTTAAGQGTYAKQHSAERLRVVDQLSTDLSAHQQLWVAYESGAIRFRLKRLTAATCTITNAGEPDEARVFEGEGITRKKAQLNFKLSERQGGFYFEANANGSEKFAERGPLRAKQQTIE